MPRTSWCSGPPEAARSTGPADLWPPRSLSANNAKPVEARDTRPVGHTGGSNVTELIYRKQIRPKIADGTTAIDRLSPNRDK